MREAILEWLLRLFDIGQEAYEIKKAKGLERAYHVARETVNVADAISAATEKTPTEDQAEMHLYEARQILIDNMVRSNTFSPEAYNDALDQISSLHELYPYNETTLTLLEAQVRNEGQISDEQIAVSEKTALDMATAWNADPVEMSTFLMQAAYDPDLLADVSGNLNFSDDEIQNIKNLSAINKNLAEIQLARMIDQRLNGAAQQQFYREGELGGQYGNTDGVSQPGDTVGAENQTHESLWHDLKEGMDIGDGVVTAIGLGALVAGEGTLAAGLLLGTNPVGWAIVGAGVLGGAIYYLLNSEDPDSSERPAFDESQLQPSNIIGGLSPAPPLFIHRNNDPLQKNGSALPGNAHIPFGLPGGPSNILQMPGFSPAGGGGHGGKECCNNIYISKLVETINITCNCCNDGINEMQSMVAQALVKAAQDYRLAQRH